MFRKLTKPLSQGTDNEKEEATNFPVLFALIVKKDIFYDVFV